MKIDLSSEPPQIVVFLSKRNLRALLHKLSQTDQAAMLATRNIWIDDELAPSALALVVAEEDDEHYSEPTPRTVPSPGEASLPPRPMRAGRESEEQGNHAAKRRVPGDAEALAPEDLR